MTDYEEEQQMEVEALESIYLQDFEQIESSPLKFKLNLVPHPGDDDENKATYPEEKPELQVEITKGLAQFHVKEMDQIVSTQVEENLGAPMIFTVAEALKEYLVENNRDDMDDSGYSMMMRQKEEREKAKQMEEEKKRAQVEKERGDVEVMQRSLVGTPVTPETFQAWLISFEAEMNKDKVIKKPVKGKESGLTGKQLFLQGLVDNVGDQNEEDEEGEEDHDAGGAGTKDLAVGAVDGSIFLAEGEEEDLEDLDDILSSEDED